MSILRIRGGAPLKGTLTASGNKNAVLPMIAAAVLTDEEVCLENVPAIDDVRTMLTIAEAAGANVTWNEAEGRAGIRCGSVTCSHLPRRECERIRASILFAAPILARTGTVTMAPPGGDVIGRRRLESHLHGLTSLGAEVTVAAEFRFNAPALNGADIFLPEASVTATAQVIMGAVLARGVTVIRNAACEPHIQDLCLLLCAMGARITGIGTNTVHIDGVRALHGTRYKASSDYTEAGSYLALAAATGGDLTVTGTDPTHYRMVARVFRRLGIDLDVRADSVAVRAGQPCRVEAELTGGFPTIDDGIWPQFPSDLMSVTIVLATQVRGTVLFFEKMYESRMYFIDRLVSMGANAVVCDPHRAVISGPSQLHGVTMSSPDIRAGIALVGAALCARGESRISNVELIDRGYQHIESRLSSLGADVERLQA